MSSITEQSYFQKTLSDIGITEEQNTFTVIETVGRFDSAHEAERVNKLFDTDQDDNFIINYYDLRGLPYSYRKEGNKWPVNYRRTRLKKPFINNENGEIKYLSPKESGMFPYFPPAIITKYKNKTPIPILIITEGEKKAFVGCASGLDVVGIPSIHGFYSGDIKGKLHEDIQELIIACKVEKIIYLTDADTLVIKWKYGKDLYNRQNTFYNAVKLFRESLQLLLDDQAVALANVYFTHIETKYVEDGKGLDDLLAHYKAQEKEIIDDLYKLQFSNRFFSTKIITDGKPDKIFRYFALNNEKDFHSLYKKYIGNNEFVFRGRHYEFDGEEVRYVRHQDADRFMRIGDDWCKIARIPDKYGELQEEIIPFSVTEIKRDYARFPDFLDQINKYDGFCNVPCWNEEYRRVHSANYNICNPITHIPSEGNWDNTYKFLKHVFGGQSEIRNGIECGILGDQFSVALDWLTIIYKYPKQMVPVPLLVSKEYRTGKSTFLKWLQAIYQTNMSILGNEQFKMKFNAHYITKFVIALDEGFLDVDKKAEKERLKQLATADTVYLENKGMNLKKVSYYGKLIICSNDADNVMKIEEGENRWFVIKVPPIPDSEVDPDLEKKMKEEIPAFLYYIKHRNIVHPKQDRLWFKTEHFITEQFRKIVDMTRNYLEKEVIDFIQELFLNYKQSVMYIDVNWIVNQINREAKYKISKYDVKVFLKEKKKMVPEGLRRVSIPIGYQDGVDGKHIVTFQTYVARPYQFLIQDWLDESSITKENTNNEDNDLPF